MSIIEYKGIEIFEDSDHDTWQCCYRTKSHELSSGNRIGFSSGWYDIEHFTVNDAKAAINSVKRQIDEFICKSTTPDINDYRIGYRAKFFYYASNPTRWGYTPEKICEYCKEHYRDTNFSNVNIQIDIHSHWVEYFDNFVKTNENITTTNKRTEATEVHVYGSLIENNEKYRFRVIYNHNSEYAEIEIEDENNEYIADKIAQLIGVYEAKEFAITLKSKV